MPSREEVVEFLAGLRSGDYSEVVSEADSRRRERFEQEMAQHPLPVPADRDNVARWLAMKHIAIDPGIETVYYLQNSPEDEIRFIEVNRSSSLPDLVGEPLYAVDFGLNVEGFEGALFVVDVTPGQLQRIESGELPLPETWSWLPHQRFIEPGA